MAVNRKNDYAFKRIFGHEDTKDILARFLTVVLLEQGLCGGTQGEAGLRVSAEDDKHSYSGLRCIRMG